MRKHLEKIRLENVKYKLVNNLYDARSFMSGGNEKYILKPVDGNGSRGVFSVTLDNINNYANVFKTGVYLIEQFFVGEEYSVEAVSYQGIHQIVAITKKFIDLKTHIEVGHVVPAPITKETDAQIRLYVSSFLQVMGIRNGVTHTEIKVSNQNIQIIESHTRIAGDKIPLLVKNSYGINLWEISAEFTFLHSKSNKLFKLIQCIKEKQYPLLATAIMYILPDQFGRITSISGLENVPAFPGYIYHEMKKGLGDLVHLPAHSHDRLGYVVFSGETSEIAVLRAQQALKLIKYEIE
jgi:biotin carboxylase